MIEEKDRISLLKSLIKVEYFREYKLVAYKSEFSFYYIIFKGDNVIEDALYKSSIPSLEQWLRRNIFILSFTEALIYLHQNVGGIVKGEEGSLLTFYEGRLNRIEDDNFILINVISNEIRETKYKIIK